MQIRELAPAEIQYALSLDKPNDRKSYAQSLIIDEFVKAKKLLVTAHTRFGKGWLIRTLLERYRRVSSDWVNIVLPTNVIRDELEKHLAGIPNLRFYLNATYASGNLPEEEYSCGMLIADECHRVLSTSAKAYSTVIPRTKTDRILLLSATIDEEKKQYLQSLGITREFTVPLKTGVRLGIVPPYQSLNIPVDLTPDEAKKYLEQQDKIDNYIRLFQHASPERASQLAFLCAQPHTPEGRNAIANTAKVLGFLDTNGVIGAAMNYRKCIGARANILYTASEKEKLTLELLKYFPDQKVIVFGSRLAVGDQLAKSNPKLQVYRTGATKAAKEKTVKLLADFYSGKKPYIYGCNNLNEGFTVNDCSTAINIGIKSVQLTDQQRTGRVLGLDPDNPDKLATKINVYVQSGEYQGRAYSSMEEKWLEKSQQNQLFISYVSGLDELLQYISTPQDED